MCSCEGSRNRRQDRGEAPDRLTRHPPVCCTLKALALTTDGLARIENVIAEHPALILEFGGNDGLRGIPVDATKKNMQEMISRLQQARIPIVLLGITLPPNYGPDYVKAFTAIFPELAKEYHLKLMPFLLLNVYQHSEMMQPDGIHPNGEGNQVVARDVFRLIQPMLRKGE